MKSTLFSKEMYVMLFTFFAKIIYYKRVFNMLLSNKLQNVLFLLTLELLYKQHLVTNQLQK